MCGICGFSGLPDNETLKSMCRLMKHRGPDEGGLYVTDLVSLGHVRLSIVDLLTGHQPMSNEDGSIILVCNGEIYNHLDLRHILESKGHIFESRSDIETIVHCYEEYGSECVDQLNGCFSFAIWDENKRTLLLARDRLGIRPLYYTFCRGRFLFASELKSLLAFPGIQKTLSLPAIDSYLTFRYVRGRQTIFKSIYRLPPGTIAEYADGRLQERRYWSVRYYPSEFSRKRDYCGEFSELLADSVRLRLMSDVPYGAYLSGGLDSSMVVGLMTRFSRTPFSVFSVGFGCATDEVTHARKVGEELGASFKSIEVSPSDMDLFPKAVWHIDEPFGDAIILPMYMLSELARQSVKVVLSGEGADELLGGYVHQKALLKADRFGHLLPCFASKWLLPGIIKSMPVRLLDSFFDYPVSMGQSGKRRLSRLLGDTTDRAAAYASFVSLFTDEEKARLLVPEYDRMSAQESYYQEAHEALQGGEAGYFPNLITFEFEHWLPSNILFKQDKTTMANSVEGRVPFLDHRLVEYCSRLPLEVLLARGTQKSILRESFQLNFPRLRLRQKKQAFMFPLSGRFRHKFQQMLTEYLGKSAVEGRGLFKYEFISNLLAGWDGADILTGKKLMCLLLFEIWAGQIMDKEVK